MTLVNSPVEISVRVLALLDLQFPQPASSHRLTMLDYALVHSGDLGGPTSIHPTVPVQISELGVRRSSIDQALQILLKVGMIEALPTSEGIGYRAAEGAEVFLSLFSAPYFTAIREHASWVLTRFGGLSDGELRSELYVSVDRWRDQFDDRTLQ